MDMKLKTRIYSKYLNALQYRSFPYRSYLKRNKCVFVHIPKAAGSSILCALGKKSGGRDHLPWYVYYTANPRKYAAYYKFCFVRNPWDRVYSAYRYLSRGGNMASDLSVANALGRFGSFDGFVIDGLGQGYYRSHLLFLPQASFVVGPDEAVMVDFVGRYENLDSDFRIIASRLSLDGSLPQVNMSTEAGKIDYRNAYCSPESIEIVAEVYRQDVLSFGYDFGGENG